MSLQSRKEYIGTMRRRYQETKSLARRIARWDSPKFRRALPHKKPNGLRSEIPIECYAWNEDKPGALEIDLVEHNGGSSLGHFAYDNAHVEQKNRQYVREIVGYERFDTPEAVEWLNQVYGLLDTYKRHPHIQALRRGLRPSRTPGAGRCPQRQHRGCS